MSRSELMLFVFIICTAGFSTVIQLLTLVLFSLFNILKRPKILFLNRWIFYALITFISFSQLLFIGDEDYGLNYILNTLIITFMWYFMLQSSNFIVSTISEIQQSRLELVLIKVFNVNAIVVLIQAIILFISRGGNPFVEDNAGDFIRGIFSFSSSNMIVMAFYSIFFTFKKYYKLLAISILVMLLTYFMSGLLFFIISISIYGLTVLNFVNKIKLVATGLSVIFLFSIISPGNIRYAQGILSTKLNSEDDPIRKIESIKQTYLYWTESWLNFVFGAGGGKFSSRTAFITAGEYVYYPKDLIYLSPEFKKNHFQLWNNQILSNDHMDGTANQPFSFYNKIVGEYGLIGIFLFILYLTVFLRNYKRLSFGKVILITLPLFLFLDYWFEYFTVIIFFEAFMFIDMKRGNDQQLQKTEHLENNYTF